jgi:hypothetical protein
VSLEEDGPVPDNFDLVLDVDPDHTLDMDGDVEVDPSLTLQLDPRAT